MVAIGYGDYTVLDCPDPLVLARFYRALLGGDISREDEGYGEWVELRVPRGNDLAFQRATNLVVPTWPEPGIPQQIHLDVFVEDIEAAEREVLAAGATRTGLPHPAPGYAPRFRVYRDPAGHPFCLCWRLPEGTSGISAPGWLGQLE
ncbi:VOC family protein [Klugiella xanthotipulae]|uniref:VOC domain-containing protein n=1 Tax=Klugiella xanthotipulae TaxID=244735 RepID=A0A543I3U6_9MICO|nr:VOC family protein [Klugiella xanthotipulae]TQM65273.1 hypothetical protein FB466_0064 [Klugiella xanthotipulae]